MSQDLDFPAKKPQAHVLHQPKEKTMLPSLTPEARAAALAKGVEARKARADAKNRLKAGTATMASVLRDADSDATLAKMKVQALLEAMPGVGKVRATQIRERIGISETRRIGGLGPNQREALEQEFAPLAA